MTRNVPVAHQLLWAVLAAVLAGLFFAPAVRAKTDVHEPARVTKSRLPLVVVRGLGSTTPNATRLACRALLEHMDVLCEIRASRSLAEVRFAWNPKREQLDARAALGRIFRDRASDAIAEINLTSVDIYETTKPYIFGLASLTDRVALVSLARIGGDDADFASRLGKLVVHETLHSFGLHHHHDQACVMRQDPSVAALDTAPSGPCSKCQAKLDKQTKTLVRPGQLALDRSRSYLVRGEPSMARQYLLSTVWAGVYTHDLLLDFGTAFYDAGEWDDSIGIFRFLIEADAQDANGHVRLGLAYQARAQQGDVEAAIDHFEQALALRPEWTTVAAHLTGLQSPRAQGPAR